MRNLKYVKDFKAGDVVLAHGAVFRITMDARVSYSHGPMAGHLERAHGPSDCALCIGVCIGGQETPGYIKIGREWIFQGNLKAGKYEVVDSF